MTDQLLKLYTPFIESLTLIPSGGGRFEVMADDTRIFSKKQLGRHAEPGEIARLLEERVGFKQMPLD